MLALNNLAALFVGDDAPARTALGRWAKGLGLRLDVATDAATAMDLARAHDYDAVLFELGGSGLDGPTFYRALKLEKPDLARRAVALTSDLFNDAVLRFLVEARCRWLLKPLDLVSVATVVGRASAAA